MGDPRPIGSMGDGRASDIDIGTSLPWVEKFCPIFAFHPEVSTPATLVRWRTKLAFILGGRVQDVRRLFGCGACAWPCSLQMTTCRYYLYASLVSAKLKLDGPYCSHMNSRALCNTDSSFDAKRQHSAAVSGRHAAAASGSAATAFWQCHWHAHAHTSPCGLFACVFITQQRLCTCSASTAAGQML